MRKTKTYSRTRFPASVFAEVFNSMGPDRSFFSACIDLPDGILKFDSEEPFLNAYASSPIRSYLTKQSGVLSLLVMASSTETKITVEGPEWSLMNRLLELFEGAVQAARLPDPLVVFDIQRSCVVAPLPWETLPLLATQLAQHGITIESQTIELSRYPDTTKYSAWDPVIKDIRKNGESKYFTIWFHGTGPARSFSLSIRKDRYYNTEESYLRVDLGRVHDERVADDVVRFLGLKPDQPSLYESLPRSAFVAHRFDAQGEHIADRLARFLELLGFDVKTGRGFSPEPVGDKVRKRIESQAVLFLVLTSGDDETWLTQESILAYAKEKRVVILREMRAPYKAGLLGDLEYITFQETAIEGAFISILEGLRELGFLR